MGVVRIRRKSPGAAGDFNFFAQRKTAENGMVQADNQEERNATSG